MMRLTWLADILRAAGLEVVEHGDWLHRGRDLNSVEGVVWHHTATRATATDEAVCRILINGRSDLPGPLCHLGLDRHGRYHVIAGGRANHNGYGLWGNQSVGIEAFNDGVGEKWPVAQVDAYVRGTAAICAHVGWPAAKVLAHRETDPKRKIDPRGNDMDVARARIDIALRPPTSPLKQLTPATTFGPAREYPDVKRADVDIVVPVRNGEGCTPHPLDIPRRRVHAALVTGPYPFVDGWNGLERLVATVQERDGGTHVNVAGGPDTLNADVLVTLDVDVD